MYPRKCLPNDLIFCNLTTLKLLAMGKKDEILLKSCWDAANCIGGSVENGHAMIAQNMLCSLKNTAERAGLALADSVTHRICSNCSSLLIPVSALLYITLAFVAFD